MPGTAPGTVRFRQRIVRSATSSTSGLSRIVLAGNHHARLENHAFEMHPLFK